MIKIVLLSLTLSIIFYQITQQFFLKKNKLDHINLRSSHNSVATRSGGISIFLTIFIISIFSYFNSVTLFEYKILVPLSLLLFTGIYDDIYNIDYKLKFIFQIIAAKIFVDSGLIIDNFHGVFGLFEINRGLAQVLTIFIIISIINSFNFIDGIDGLAISVFLFFIIGFELLSESVSPYYFLNLILISSIIPLYYFNYRKNKKVFLGDSGSHFLGGVISLYVIYILSSNYYITEEYDILKPIFVFSILSYPIIDIIRVFVIRIINKKSPFIADNNHIHHLMLKGLKKHGIVVSLIIIISIIIFYLTHLFFSVT